MKKILILLSCFSFSLAQATVIEDWQFNDADGTTLANLNKTAGTATFVNGTGATADGAGNLQFLNAAGDLYRNGLISTISSGAVELTWSYTGADLSGADPTGAVVGFGLGNDGAGKDLVVARLYEQNDSIRIQTRVDNTNTDFYNFGTNVITDTVNLRLVVDRDAYTFDLFYTIGAAGEVQAVDNGALTTTAGLDIDRIKMVGTVTNFSATDKVTVDYLTFSSVVIPEPSTLAIFTLGSLLIYRRRRK